LATRSVEIPQSKRTVSITELGQPSLERQEWSVLTTSRQGHEIAFHATLTGRNRSGVPQGTRPLGRDWTAEEIDRAIAWEVGKILVSPPEKRTGTVCEFDVTPYALYEANGVL